MTPTRSDVHRKLGDCMKQLGDSEGSRKNILMPIAMIKGQTGSNF